MATSEYRNAHQREREPNTGDEPFRLPELSEIRERRLRSRLTQEEIVLSVGPGVISQPRLSRLERGSVRPKPGEVERILETIETLRSRR
jgi:predicted transcriptional regulator